MQVPGLTKQSGESACVLCTSGAARRESPLSSLAADLGIVGRKEPESALGFSSPCLCDRFSGKVARRGSAQAPRLGEGRLPVFNTCVCVIYMTICNIYDT